MADVGAHPHRDLGARISLEVGAIRLRSEQLSGRKRLLAIVVIDIYLAGLGQYDQHAPPWSAIGSGRERAQFPDQREDRLRG